MALITRLLLLFSLSWIAKLTTPNPNTWSVSPLAGFKNATLTGKSYQIVSRATDIVGNAEFGPLNVDAVGKGLFAGVGEDKVEVRSPKSEV